MKPYTPVPLERVKGTASPWAYLDLAIFAVAMKVARTGNEARVLRLFANNPEQREKWVMKALRWMEMEAAMTKALIARQPKGPAPV